MQKAKRKITGWRRVALVAASLVFAACFILSAYAVGVEFAPVSLKIDPSVRF